MCCRNENIGRKLFFCAVMCLSFAVHAQQHTNKEVVAKIVASYIDDVITLEAIGTNTTEVYKSLTYTFTLFRKDDEGNVTKTIKEGRFTLEANERKKLSSISLNSTQKDQITLLLLIREDEQIRGKDRLVFNEYNNQVISRTDGYQDSVDDGVELTGIVIEETKTKPGRDFYEFFYNAYALYQINGNKIVGVFEKLSFGRATILQVRCTSILKTQRIEKMIVFNINYQSMK